MASITLTMEQLLSMPLPAAASALDRFRASLQNLEQAWADLPEAVRGQLVKQLQITLYDTRPMLGHGDQPEEPSDA